MLRRFWLAGLPAFVLTGLGLGCGGSSDAPSNYSLNSVKGKVVLEDGKPVTSGLVVLVSPTMGISPNGKINPDGTFSVRTGEQGEGAPAGEYKVRIEPEYVLGGTGKTKAAKLPFAQTYTDEDASGLKVTIKDGDNNLDPFKLSTKNAALQGPSSSSRASMRD